MHNSAGWLSQNKHSRRAIAAHQLQRGILWFSKGITRVCTVKREFEMTPASSGGSMKILDIKPEGGKGAVLKNTQPGPATQESSLFTRIYVVSTQDKKHARHTSKHSETEVKCTFI